MMFYNKVWFWLVVVPMLAGIALLIMDRPNGQVGPCFLFALVMGLGFGLKWIGENSEK